MGSDGGKVKRPALYHSKYKSFHCCQAHVQVQINGWSHSKGIVNCSSGWTLHLWFPFLISIHDSVISSQCLHRINRRGLRTKSVSCIFPIEVCTTDKFSQKIKLVLCEDSCHSSSALSVCDNLSIGIFVTKTPAKAMASWTLLLLVGFVRSQQTTTEDYTVTYNPGEECLPYDGSVVPDCSKFVDPITKWPYFHEHSTSKNNFKG